MPGKPHIFPSAATAGFRQVADRLWRDVTGAVTVYVALSMVVFLPLLALVLDFTRYLNLHTELEQAAEAAAMAAAKEMDYTTTGLDRARTAARDAVTNLQSFAEDRTPADASDDEAQVAIAEVQFLWALPPEGPDKEARYADYITTSATRAKYVRVVTEIRGVRSPFFATFYRTLNNGVAPANAEEVVTKDTVGSAVAGKRTVVCRAMPMMMCNPVEDYSAAECGGRSPMFSEPDWDMSSNPETLGDFLADNPDAKRLQWRFRFLGPNADLGIPGNFAWLEPVNRGPGTAELRDEMARADLSSCIFIDGAEVDQTTNTGQRQAAVAGLNVRFDIYDGPLRATDWEDSNGDNVRQQDEFIYPSAPNVTKGYEPGNGNNWCRADLADADDHTYSGLPQDSCFATDTCSDVWGNPGADDGVSGRIGEGDWDPVRYFAANHFDLVFDGEGVIDPVSRELVDPALRPQAEALLSPVLQSIHEWWLDNEASANDRTWWRNDPEAPTIDAATPPMRHAVYMWETRFSGTFSWTHPTDGVQSVSVPSAGGRIPGSAATDAAEEGAPQCYSGAAQLPSRRNVYVAVANCCQIAQEQTGGGSFSFPVTELAEVFLTEPAELSGGGDMGSIYGEILRTVSIEENLTIVRREFVQLY